MKNWLFAPLMMFTCALYATDLRWDNYKKQTLQFQDKIPGWCTLEKAEKMMQLIYDTHPTLCVEIGVFGGSSIYPTAKALKYLRAGVVYAIDPWATGECLEGYEPEDANYQWWGSVDLSLVYQNFRQMLITYGLTNHCKVLRMSSQQAVSEFDDESIDILHIDGNHTENVVFSDIQLFLPKVKKGGYIWFDDVHWSSGSCYTVHRALEYALASGEVIFRPERSMDNCFLFQKMQAE
jgi:predicted O-methyltransferase YrrM